ncbi:MAG: hypothetical protein JWP04_1785 [Belnapia sp.]|nr:hypothetical protein [Belnapia sp.]
MAACPRPTRRALLTLPALLPAVASTAPTLAAEGRAPQPAPEAPPAGHGAARDPEFDAAFGARRTDFLARDRPLTARAPA